MTGIRTRAGLRRIARGIVTLACLAISKPAIAEDYYASTYSLSDFGGVGLLETRTARFAPDGEFDIGVSLVNPHRRYFLNWQILPWAEATFRYVDFTNTTFAPDGGIELRPSVSDRDFFKSLFSGIPGPTILGRQFDLKFLLLEEQEYLPQIAVGLQDFIGTGETSGEYIVGSKRFRDFDFSLGIGWGYFAGRKVFKNPMRVFSSSFATRNADTSLGGTFNYKNLFAGEYVGLFGGIEYATPVRGLTLKAEYNSATNLTPQGADPAFNDFPLGIALNYRPVQAFEASIGLERGDTLMIRAALRINLHDEAIIPKFDPPLPPMTVRPGTRGLGIEENGQLMDAKVAAVVDQIFGMLEVNGISVEAVAVDPGRMRIEVGRLAPRQVEIARQAAIAAASLYPDEIKQVTFQQIGVSQDLTWFVSDLQQEAARETLIKIFNDHGFSLSQAFVRGDTADVTIAGIWQSGAGRNQARIADDVFRALSDRIKRLQVRDAVGFGWASDRRAVERLRSTDRLFDLAEDKGLQVTDLELTNGEALIKVVAFAWANQEDYRDVAAELGAALGEDIPVTLIGYEGERQVARFVSRAVGQEPDQEAQSEPKRVPLRVIEHKDQDEVAEAVFADLDGYGFEAESLLIKDREVVLYLDKAPFLQESRNAAWIAHVLSAHLPREVEKITIVRIAHGIEVSRLSFFRADVERMVTGVGSVEEIWAHTEHDTTMGRRVAATATWNEEKYPSYEWSLAPVIRQHIGAPEGIIFVDIIASLSASARITQGLTLRGAVGQFLFGNIDKLEQTTPSVLKPVRSLILEFQQEGRTSIQYLEADYIFSPAPNVAARIGAGLFEQMYGGVGGEVYFHRPNSPWAVGANLYWLRQREFAGGFGFRDLTTTTGHVSAYYDLPFYDLHAKVHLGRYLAGDWGGTFDLSRDFQSGVTVGAFATFTNVSAEEFGEGRSDRGFYMRFPLEMFALRSSTSIESFLFRPVSRDGGQMLDNSMRLPEIVRKGEAIDYRKSWRRFGT